MLKFSMSSHRITVDPKSLMIAELRDIYDSDTDLLKRQAVNILTYVHLASQIDPEAPYFSAREDEVQELVAMDVWGREWKTTQSIDGFDVLIEAYRLAYEKPENRMVQTFNHKLDQLHDMLANVRPEIEKSVNQKTGSFNYVTNTKAIMQVMKDLDEVMDAKEQLEERIKNKRNSEVKIRGQKKESFLEKKRIIDAGRKDRIPRKQEDNGSTETDEPQGEEGVHGGKRQRDRKIEEEVLGAGPGNF